MTQVPSQDQTQEKIEKFLTNPEWRLNNLYWIVDKKGEKVKFQMNIFQKYLYDNLWYLNIILKARQLGMTTFIDIFLLDSVLFSKNKHAAIIAHTKEDAEVIFNTKVKFPFDNLPDWLKKSFQVNQDTLREFKFSNGSSIRVATGVRSGTLNYLHISEFGYTCAKYPEKAQEVITGSLNAVHQGQMVFIESTAKGREGQFYEMCNRAMSHSRTNETLTEMDYKFFFFPWWQNPEYMIDKSIFIDEDMENYFATVSRETGVRISEQQKYWYIKKMRDQGDDMKSEYPSYAEEAFKASMEGSYYGKFIDRAFAEGRVAIVPYDPRLKVDTWWDLGMGDAMSIIFTQTFNKELRAIDYYESSGEGLQHYANVMQERKYLYGTHTAPHDIEVRELGTGKSRKEVARTMGIYFRVAKKLPIDDGIEAVRLLLAKMWFDKQKTAKLLSALSHYKKEWDEENATFKNKPLHDWSSHAADAMRTLAIAFREDVGNSWLTEEELEGKPARIDEDVAGTFNKFGVLAEF